MFIREAYKVGQEIKRVLKENKKDVTTVVYKLKEAKDKFKFCDIFLNTLIDNNLSADNEFMLDLLKEQNTLENVKMSLCLGIMSLDDNNKFITFAEASKKYNLADGTLRKKRERGGFKDNEVEKRGREWWISVEAMDRMYKE